MTILYWNQLSDEQKAAYLTRPAENNIATTDTVKSIIDQVKQTGDSALLALAEQYDQVSLNTLRVSKPEMNDAMNAISDEMLSAIKTAVSRITSYQQACQPSPVTVDTKDGIYCQRLPRPIDRVGLYVPGGSAPLISTVLMLAIPAQLAGCQTRVLCSPPNRYGLMDPHILVSASLCGITDIYKVGGAQAIAAMAYGTECIPRVNKIFGPGNAWVTEAKRQVSQDPGGASIDCPAGPSEVMVIADQYANAAFVAADLLSQAEHGIDSQVILVSDDIGLISAIQTHVQRQLSTLSRQSIAAQSLTHSRMILVDSLDTAIEISNQYAPEHLILQVQNADLMVPDITNVGAVFIGPWTPETMGDYITGANHVLPTYGYANRYSGLSINDFMRYISVQQVTQQGLRSLGPTAMTLAACEGLSAHKNAVAIRLTQLECGDD